MPLVRIPDHGGNSMLLMEYGNQGYLGPPEVPDQTMANIHKIEIRDDDVILCSYPKSGCHWLWEMTRMLRAGTPDVEVVEKEKYMMEYASPEDLPSLPSPRTFNTHFLFHQLPPKVQEGKVKLLFIYRNPKDVSVSFYNHHVKFPEYEYKGEFSDYLTGLFLTGKTDFGNLFTYMRNWEAVFDNRPDLPVFAVSYEEMQADTLRVARELARFLGSSVDEDVLREVVDKCSFGSMRDRKGKEWTETYGEPVMYRKGKVGDWKNWFTVAQNQLMDDVCQKEMKGSRFQFQYTL